MVNFPSFGQGRSRRRLRGVLISGAIALSCWMGTVSGSWAQAPADPPPDSVRPTQVVPPLPNNPVISPLQNWGPAEVRSLFAESDEPDLASVDLDGRSLFDVAAPLADPGTLSAVERAAKIEAELEQIAENFLQAGTPETLAVIYEIDQESNQPVIYVNDQMLMTVTYLDARINAVNSLTLRARQIADDVETALLRYYQERQPAFLWEQVRWMLLTLLITLGGSFAIHRFSHNLSDRRRQLQQQHTPSSASAVDPVQPLGPPTINRLHTTLLTRQKINSLGIARQVLQLLQVILWTGSGLLILGFFPYTRWLQPLLIDLMQLPARIALIALIAYAAIRLANLWIDRLFLIFQSRTITHLEQSQRLVLRLSTFSQVIKGLLAFGIASTAVLVMLSSLGVRVAPLLAGAGLVGFAISFASQSLIKDIINGFLVLMEDQYGVGDVITVGQMSGFVETMNLRITQLRATDGQLITIPNGQINVVQNLSKEWSRVDLMIPVGLSADINQALQLVEQEANVMRQDEIWGSLILEPPLLLGVDELSHAGATIRIWIKTLPLKQWDVAREYRRRLKIAFEMAQIPLGMPQQVVQLSGPYAPSRALGTEETGTNGLTTTPDATAHLPAQES